MKSLSVLTLSLTLLGGGVWAQEPEVTEEEEELALREGDWTHLVVTLKGGKKVTYARSEVVRVQYLTRSVSTGSSAGGGAAWMGKVWKMRETAPDGRYCDGVWTRQGNTNRFSGVWTCSWGARATDTLVVQLRGNNLVIHREGLNQNYTGTLAGDQRSANGKTWGPGGLWSAKIQ